MDKVLTLPQREQSGSDTYNRFEYQVHWIVNHIIDRLQTNELDYIVFCEFHDDMTELSINDNKYQFYQIKTKEDKKLWSISAMSQKIKNKNGHYKKSFLGYIFENFLRFGEECACCYFVSNNGFDNDVLLWQSYIEDKKKVSTENKELYIKIRERIINEYDKKELPKDFDAVFEVFLQNTYICESNLQLSTYIEQTNGQFFKHLADKDIPTNTANLILQQLINDVRKKSAEKIQTPISHKKLIEKKGIIVTNLNEKINNGKPKNSSYDRFYHYLSALGLSKEKVLELKQEKTLHDSKWLNMNDIVYQEIVITIRKCIDKTISTCKESVNLDELKKYCINELKNKNLLSISMSDNLIEVLYYEHQFNQNNQ